MNDTCPKCGRPARAADTSCARCGLLRERWATYSTQPQAHPTLDPLWQQALENWEDEKRHKALAVVAGGRLGGALGAGAALQRRAARAAADPIATAAVDQLIKAAMGLPPPARSKGPSPGVQAVRAARRATLVISVYLMFLLFRHTGKR